MLNLVGGNRKWAMENKRRRWKKIQGGGGKGSKQEGVAAVEGDIDHLDMVFDRLSPVWCLQFCCLCSEEATEKWKGSSKEPQKQLTKMPLLCQPGLVHQQGGGKVKGDTEHQFVL